jgi:hypothetical protein
MTVRWVLVSRPQQKEDLARTSSYIHMDKKYLYGACLVGFVGQSLCK